ncbi:hypothetical protein [Edaphobacter sp. 12200R-103]|uniref:hypothetical protein n=1 Tax=Edaphobacter sp. 12200R-103 TaxID=2703788 RepID=UPI00138C8220|nr:hypothetical protein [Edaphobacter sp. 12200R-103]QHS51299.1 hypothetical protein GWR55_05745 [Edaphobacter sp. 12200R-103]
MNRPGVLSLALLLGASFALPSQSLSQSMSQSVIAQTMVSGMGAGCPVSLQAQRSGIPTVIVTNGRVPIPAARLQLNWGNRQRKQIVAAAIFVHGFDATPRVIPAGSGTAASAELQKGFAVKLNLSGDGQATTDLTLQRFATVSSIELKSIEYADGSRWNISAGQNCSIAPNPYLPVTATVIAH